MMTSIPSGPPGTPSPGERQQRATQLKSEIEAKAQQSQQARSDQSAQANVKRTGPAGEGNYVVKQGDCISSIAKDTGHFWETIWNDPGNTELKEIRKDPNVLLPGDRITIPEIEPKKESGATEERHRFVRRGEPFRFEVRILRSGKPVANCPFTLNLDGTDVSGTTDADGHVVCDIVGNAERATLTVTTTRGDLVYQFRLGAIDPIDEVSGIQARLSSLGFYNGPANGKLNDATLAALQAFQAKYELEPVGDPGQETIDQATKDKLVEVYGS